MIRKEFLRFALIFFVISFFISLSLTAKEGVQKAELEGFSEFVETIMREWEIPGVAICIIKDGEVVFSEGFGYRDIKTGIKVTPKTIFAIGSCTKAFTATCLGILVDEGRLDWDKPVREYLPSFKLKDPFASERMTPRDLLCHRSGLPGHDYMWVSASDDSPTREELFERLQYLEPNKDFRTTYENSNLMYQVAGNLVRQITGMTWEEFVQERIFKSLGMKETNVSLAKTRRSSDFALPYWKKEKVKVFTPSPTVGIQPTKIGAIVTEEKAIQIPFQSYENAGPCGSINSNIIDMAKWILLNLNKGKHEEKQIISEATLKEIHSPQIICSWGPLNDYRLYNEVSFGAYGLGWFITAYRGHLMFWHTGGALGLNSMVSLMPQDNIGLVILTNMEQWRRAPMAIIRNNIYDRLLGLDQIPWDKRLKDEEAKARIRSEEAKEEKDKDRKLNTKPSHPLEDYTGNFHNPGYGTISIEKEGDHLRATYNSFSYVLSHYHYDIFEAGKTEISGFTFESFHRLQKLSFITDFKGNIQGVVVQVPFAGGIEIVFTKKPEKE